MKKIAAVLSITIVFSGCASPPLQAPQATTEYITIPEINQEATAEIGQTIISRVLVTRIPAILVLKEINDPISTIPIPVGILPLSQVNEQGKLYESGIGPTRSSWEMIPQVFIFNAATRLVSKDKTEFGSVGIFVPKDSSKPATVYAGGGSVIGTNPVTDKIQHTMKEKTHEGSFKRELIYTGISQNTLSILYREFKNDFARPSFSQDIKYDLSQSKMIGYKGARFEVISASNTEIVYKVIRPID